MRGSRASTQGTPPPGCRDGLNRFLLCSAALLALCRPALAADSTPLIRNDFGGAGLIDMPDARMAPDGTLSVGASFMKNTQHYNFGFQMLPWLETGFRYTGLDHFDPAYPVYYDRSFALKARLWQEGDFFPAVAIGVNDLVGTGIYSGEYVVASKQFGDVDATLGMGWGRLSSTNLFENPFGLAVQSFKQRASFGFAGSAHFSTFFHGPDVGLFGGLTWTTPIDGLSLIGEYSSDRYTVETSRGNIRPRNQYNLGATYRITDTTSAGLHWLYGDSIGANFSFELDPTTDPFPQRLGAEPPQPTPRTPEQQQQALNFLMQRQGADKANVRRPAQTGALVDALWQGGFGDVALNGQTLSLTLSAGNPNQACRNAAALVGRYSADIRIVRVNSGPAHSQCPVMAIPTILPRDEAIRANFGATALAGLTTSQADLLTIDASKAAPTDAMARVAVANDSFNQQIIIQAIDFSGGVATVYYSNTRYFAETDALNRLIRLLMNDMPARIEKFRLISTLGGETQSEFDVLRAPAERSLSQTGTLEFADNVTMLPAPMHNPILTASEHGTYPRFGWSIFPQFRQELFDPNNPFAMQFVGGVSGTLEVLPGLALNAEVEASIWDNFNVKRPAGSLLPHVRSNFLTYFTKGKNGIGDLEADYHFRITPSLFAVVRTGYLESMFAGTGGEVLWRPGGQRWALGVDAYEVWQRDFDRLFGLQKYRVTTGHVSLYYASPWYGLNFTLRAGQYLAGDRGLTFETTRRFSTGVEIGAFMTKTNVSSQQFGEGSFDKGVIIRIPLGWVLPVNTQDQLSMDLRPVQRDGGQQLLGDTPLYDETRRASETDILMDEAAMAPP